MRKKKRIAGITAFVLVCAMLFTGCAQDNNAAETSQPLAASVGEETETEPVVQTDYEAVTADFSKNDLNSDWDSEEATNITLDGSSATVSGDGATADNSVVTISEEGTYVLSGTLANGQIMINAGDDAIIQLVLNGVALSSQSGAPIYVENADKVVVTLADGFSNTVEETAGSEETAAIYSKDDLTFNGTGQLIVNAYSGAGIVSNDDLKIVSGAISVTCVGDALKGNDSISVKDGAITLEAGCDGMETTNEEKGYIDIEGGTIMITASLDGIQAQTGVLIASGDVNITTGDGSENSSSQQDSWGSWQQSNPFGGSANSSSDETTDSAKGLKAVSDITITGGNVTIDSSDDAMHSNGTLTINDGTITVSSGDDGIHADTAISVSGGEISVLQSYEGLESADIGISGGSLYITSSDDGINVAGGSDSSSMGGRPGQNGFASSDGSSLLSITGGYIVVNAAGDGLDSNGSISMTNGIVLVYGPTDSGNGALDFSSFSMDGGLLIAVGSAGMAQVPDSSSAQNVVSITLNNSVDANTVIAVAADDGTPVVVFSPEKTCQSVVISSPLLETGATYTVYTGGTVTGEATDGLYTDNSYTAGNEVESFTISSTVTTVGNATQGMNGGFGGGKNGGHGMR